MNLISDSQTYRVPQEMHLLWLWVCGERRQVRKCYWAEMVRVAGEDRPDLSCHSPDAPCSLVPGLDYPRILGMEPRTWRITDRIVEDYNRYLWCFTGWRHEY